MSLINRNIGINISAEEVASLLTRMCLRSEVCEDGKNVSIEVPPTRAGEPLSRVSIIIYTKLHVRFHCRTDI